jgi:hypothetical protein
VVISDAVALSCGDKLVVLFLEIVRSMIVVNFLVLAKFGLRQFETVLEIVLPRDKLFILDLLSVLEARGVTWETTLLPDASLHLLAQMVSMDRWEPKRCRLIASHGVDPRCYSL